MRVSGAGSDWYLDGARAAGLLPVSYPRVGVSVRDGVRDDGARAPVLGREPMVDDFPIDIALVFTLRIALVGG